MAAAAAAAVTAAGGDGEMPVPPILAAAAGGDVTVLRTLLAASGGGTATSAASASRSAASLLATTDEDGRTPYLIAAAAGHVAAMRELASHGADTHVRDVVRAPKSVWSKTSALSSTTHPYVQFPTRTQTAGRPGCVSGSMCRRRGGGDRVPAGGGSQRAVVRY